MTLLTDDPHIPGFRVGLNMAPALPLKAEDAYLCAIEFTYLLASYGWEVIIRSGYRGKSKEVNGVKIGIVCVTKPQDQQQLQWKHIAYGILETMNKLASREEFCFTKASLYVYNKLLGEVAIGRREVGNLVGVSGVNLIQSEKSPILKVRGSPNPAGAGKIVDPEDKNFVIMYTMTGEGIPCTDLLNAALNAMVQSAVADDHRHCRDFAGFSSSGKLIYRINGIPRGTTQYALTYKMVRTMFRLLPAKLYELKSCGAVSFRLLYNDEQIGIGHIRVSDFQDRNAITIS